MDINYDGKTVEGFGQEWTEYDQSNLSEKELKEIFDSYFELFPFGSLPKDAIGFDMGCGSGRWSKLVAPQVGRLYCIDASNDALKVAQKNLANLSNCEFLNASFEDIPLNDHSMDFGYCLGVFHCIPNVAEGMKSCVKKLKPGAPFLVYIYYAFDNRPMWFRAIWRVSDVGRKFISRLPFRLKNYVTKFIALFIYYPF